MSGNNIPERWLDQHNAKVAQHIAECKLHKWIQRELGGEETGEAL